MTFDRSLPPGHGDYPEDRRIGVKIFRDDADRQDFLQALAEACQKTGFEVHAYCLMRNHFHLVVQTPEANLPAGTRWLLSACIRCNWSWRRGSVGRRR